jgi:alpha-L-fucosidase
MMLVFVIVFSALSATAQLVDMTKRAAELKDLKWGMFISWSFSTFSGKEWTEQRQDPSFFRAKSVDVEQWVKTAKEAEMGYILFLTKHVDGFCLWDTQTTDHKVTKAPLGKDILKLLRESCDRHGIKLALYYCEADIFGKRPEIKKAQLKELLTQYGPIEYLWLDHGYRSNDGGLSHEETTKWCRQWQPYTLVGYNHGQPSGEISLRECGRPGPIGDTKAASFNKANEAKHQGYLLAEFTYPILPEHRGGAMWFYSLPVHDGLCKSAESLYRDYLGAVQYGNIFSIDVGPDYEGKLRKIDVETLRTVGEMIRDRAPMPEQPKIMAVAAGLPVVKNIKGDDSVKEFTAKAPKAQKVATINGIADEGEYAKTTLLTLKQTPERDTIRTEPASAKIFHDGNTLYIMLSVPVKSAANVSKDENFGQDDGIEICFCDESGPTPGLAYVIQAFPTGKIALYPVNSDAAYEEAQKMAKNVKFSGKINEKSWTCELAIPLESVNLKYKPGMKLGFNIGLWRSQDNEWIIWRGAEGSTTQLENGGKLILE